MTWQQILLIIQFLMAHKEEFKDFWLMVQELIKLFKDRQLIGEANPEIAAFFQEHEAELRELFGE